MKEEATRMKEHEGGRFIIQSKRSGAVKESKAREPRGVQKEKAREKRAAQSMPLGAK